MGALSMAGLVANFRGLSDAAWTLVMLDSMWFFHWEDNSIKRSMSIFGPSWPNPLPLRQDIYEVFELCTG
jgi:hypothetical protein